MKTLTGSQVIWNTAVSPKILKLPQIGTSAATVSGLPLCQSGSLKRAPCSSSVPMKNWKNTLAKNSTIIIVHGLMRLNLMLMLKMGKSSARTGGGAWGTPSGALATMGENATTGPVRKRTKTKLTWVPSWSISNASKRFSTAGLSLAPCHSHSSITHLKTKKSSSRITLPTSSLNMLVKSVLGSITFTQ